MPRARWSKSPSLLQAGFDSIAAHGWQDLSLRKLASSCKVSHVASYRYFKNKDDLMFALVPRISKHLADFLALRSYDIVRSEERSDVCSSDLTLLEN